MERQHAAYLIIFLMVAVIGGAIAYARHNTRDRRVERRRTRERVEQDRRNKDRSGDPA